MSNQHSKAIKALSAALHKRQYQWNITESKINNIFDLCHNSNPQYKENQDIALQMGMIDDLAYFAGTATNVRCQILAFRAIGQICFENKLTSNYVGRNTALINLALLTLNNSEDNDLREESLYSIKNAAANSWETHSTFILFIPSVVKILQSSSYNALRAQCIFFIGVLAYNSSLREQLIEMGAVEPLVEVIKSSNEQLYPTSAALALACLVGGDKKYDYIFDNAKQLPNQLLQAFEATLQKRPYPPGSELYFTDWKLMMGLSHLCRNQTCREAMIQKGFLSMIEIALSRPDQKLRKYGLDALWLCSQPSFDDKLE
eukprot:c18122_g1_i1.p1 GENE.c18122_g1_i1~~c18122_g1_i1.p1  ORF type:complete len:324 (+),score=111.14 c18122_g1_i1:26-973(+)